jgi:thiamine-phosphate pyrophosphorylase
MTICLVTDRRRRSPVEQAAEAVDAGVDIIQIRERDIEAAELVALVTRVVRVARGSPTRVVVNDRLDVAMACNAHGVHLRGDSVAPARVREMVPPGFLVGRSVHQIDEAIAVAPHVDYLIAGTVFPTSSKPGRTELLGLSGLASIAAAVRVPVLAIGGIAVEHAGDLGAAGAAGIAAVSLFADAERPIKEVIRPLRARFNIGGDFSSPP